MSRQNKHIISRLRWNTVFNNRDKATELQSRLSNWSRQVFEREIQPVLNRYCVNGQVWQINRLELDLGVIEYDDLEAGLLKKVKQALHEELYRLLVNSKTGTETTVQVMDEQVSGIRLLSGFLLHGVIPWQYAPGIKDINQVFHDELVHHSDAVMDMLNEVARNRREVRRRIAWQVSEPNIISVIKQLEPANSNIIVEFAGNLATVQEKETVVQAASGEFKKNVWFWVLNYLFTLHGSLFNKKEFLKSSIRQMAAHYNTGYEELLVLIRQLVSGIAGNIQYSGFLQALNLLLSEHTGNKINEHRKPKEETAANPEQVKEYILKQTYRSEVNGRAVLNKTIQQAAQEPWFGNWVRSTQTTVPAWQHCLNYLDEPSMEILVSNFRERSNGIFIEYVHLFAAVCTAAGWHCTRKGLLTTAIQTVIKKAAVHKINNPAVVLEILLHCTAQITRQPVARLLEVLLETELPVAYKTPLAVQWRNRLETMCTQWPQCTTATQLNRALRLYTNSHTHSPRQQKAIRQLSILFKKDAAGVVRLLQQHPGKQSVRFLLEQTLTPVMAPQLLIHISPQKVKWIKQVHAILVELKKEPRTSALYTLAVKQVYTAGIIALVIQKQQGYVSFLRLFVQQLYTQVPGVVQQQFGLLLNKLFHQPMFPQFSVPEEQQLSMERKYGFTRSAAQVHNTSAGKFFAENGILKKQPAFNGAGYEHNTFFDAVPETAGTTNVIVNGYTEELNFIQQCIADETAVSSNYPNNRMNFAVTLKILLTGAPAGLFRLLQQYPATTQRMALLYRYITVKELAAAALRFITGEAQIPVRRVQSVYEYAIHNARLSTQHILVQQVKKLMYELVCGKQYAADTFSESLNKIIAQLSVYTRQPETQVNKTLNRIAIQLWQPVGPNEIPDSPSAIPVLWLKKWLYRKAIPVVYPNWEKDLLNYCIQQQPAPEWLNGWGLSVHKINWFETLLLCAPAKTARLLNNTGISAIQKTRLCAQLNIPLLLQATGRTHAGWENETGLLLSLHHILSAKEWNALPGVQMAQLLAEKIFSAWVSGNRRMVSPLFIWQELFWQLETVHHIPRVKIIAMARKNLNTLPGVLRKPLHKLLQKEAPQTVPQTEKNINTNSIKMALKRYLGETPSQTGVEVFNAGMVLLNNYIPMLFDRLGLTEGHRFKQEQAQLEAVHYLQYVITGQEATDEAWLPLNKLLCGLPLTHPVPAGITISEPARELVNGLITAIIGYWPAIGDTSTNGFRGNWLVRKGMLTETEEQWGLNVEKRPYDLLIAKSPFSFSVIKFPWMNKAVHVSWAY